MSADLVAFILARVAEDEANLAMCLTPVGWQPHNGIGFGAGLPYPFIAPARLKAQCEATRRIVMSRPAIGAAHGRHLLAVHEEVGRQREYVMRLLASVYADHPDFDPAWAL